MENVNHKSLSDIQQDISQLRSGAGSDSALLKAKSQLKLFQNNRLANTHHQLLEDKATRDAALFFLDRLYGAGDLTLRDQQVERVVPKAEKILPNAAVEVLRKVLYTDWLAEKMDTEMTLMLLETEGFSPERITDEVYLNAFRKLGAWEIRRQQIDLIGEVGHSLSKLLRLPLLSTILKMTRGAAQKANLEEFHDFLTEGVQAFKSLRAPNRFFESIQSREVALLECIRSSQSDSFDLLHLEIGA